MIRSLLRVAEHLAALSETCGETVVIGSVRGNEVVYIDVVESKQAIRYSVRPGSMRPLHANSIGKAVLSRMDSIDTRRPAEEAALQEAHRQDAPVR